MRIDSNTASITGNIVTDNWSDFEADGICLYGGSATLKGNIISSHYRGMTIKGSEATLTNNVFANNQWCGLEIIDSSTRLRHNTVTCTSCIKDYGTGICVYGGTVEMVNTILVSYNAGITVTTGSIATLEATLWGSGSWANETDWGGDGTISTGAINIWGDPAFVDPSAGDYHISANSAAIDAGVDAGVDDDIDGHPRPMGGGYDIGADEFLE
jgi:parallel beta-helix repeat protein